MIMMMIVTIIDLIMIMIPRTGKRLTIIKSNINNNDNSNTDNENNNNDNDNNNNNNDNNAI